MNKVTLLLVTLVGTLGLQAQEIQSVNANATKEATALLKYIYSIKGKTTLTGQHCVPVRGDSRLSTIHRYTKEYPAIFSQDFGFSYPGYWDGINFRQDIVDHAIRKHNDGFIIALTWHAVAPSLEEPLDFYEGVAYKMTDKEWKELITDGTELNERWKAQVDVIAWFLKQLQYANVPVLWRPYHEMNGDLFWWGQKPGENGYQKLYKMMYERFTNFHKLNNLVWIYNGIKRRERTPETRYNLYYPGDEYVDILGSMYLEKEDIEDYNEVLELAKGKPISIGGGATTPSVEMLEEQPQWAFFINWNDPDNYNEKNLKKTYASDKVTNHKGLPWVNIKEYKLHYPIIK